MHKNNSTKFSLWLEKMDIKFSSKSKGAKLLWQAFKFLLVSLLVTLIQLALVNLMYFLMKNWTEPLPIFLELIFTETVMGEGHSNWGYILPFFLSNLIANSVGYYLNKHKTFKSDAPWWHYFLYIVILFLLITFTTWIQGLVANLFVIIHAEGAGPTVASMAAGTIQMLALFPLQKYVLLREKPTQKPLELSLEDNEWPLEYIDHERQIVRAIVVDNENNFYFVRVNRDDDFGKCEFIETSGGGVENSENLETAIKRELKEELGVDVEILSKLGVVKDYYNLIHRKNINNYYLCRIVSFGETNLTKEEIDDFHLSTVKLTFEEAINEYEKGKSTPLGRLIYNREVPILKHSKNFLKIK